MSSIRPKKSLGQHFLRDDRIAKRIVEAMNPAEGDVVLEIGPGEGALTKHLAETKANLILVDVDDRVIEKMNREYGGRATVLHRDVLEIDPAEIARNGGNDRIRVIGNIPYNITSPILFHFLDRRASVRDMVMMVQREVARRMVSVPGSKEYGIVSVFCRWMTDPEYLFEVQPGSFSPPPEVVSSVVRLSVLAASKHVAVEEAWFRTVVRTAFNQRRKTLRNSLKALAQGTLTGIDPEILSLRPERLEVAQFVALANALRKTAVPTGEPNDEE
jgi:16S rRNA (adenine1518-N6/adenine1519-N6)-dimethyltransferase